jgi:hypothetical protein
MRLVGMVLGLLPLGACGSSADPCEAERIEVVWPATITQGGTPAAAALADQVSPSNVGVPAFETLRAVLTGDVLAATEGVVWTVPAFAPAQGYVAVAIDAPVSAGESLAIGATFDGAGWGPYQLPGGVRIAAGLRAGAATADEVTGTVEVLAVSPLRLRLDLTGRQGGDDIARVQGDASFSYRAGPPACD